VEAAMSARLLLVIAALAVTAANLALVVKPKLDALSPLDVEVATLERRAARVAGLVCTDVCRAGDATADEKRLGLAKQQVPVDDVSRALVPLLSGHARAAGLELVDEAPGTAAPASAVQDLDLVPLQLTLTGPAGAVGVFVDAVSRTPPNLRVVRAVLSGPRAANGTTEVQADITVEVPRSRATGAEQPEQPLAARQGLDLLSDRVDARKPTVFFPAAHILGDAGADELPAYDPTGLRDPFALPATKVLAGSSTPLTGKECTGKPLLRPQPAPVPPPPGDDDLPAEVVDPRTPEQRNTTIESRLDELRIAKVDGRCALVVDAAGRCHEVRAGDAVSLVGAVASNVTVKSVAVTRWTTNPVTGAEFARKVEFPVQDKGTLPPGFCAPRR